jgi:hypothetical protein
MRYAAPGAGWAADAITATEISAPLGNPVNQGGPRERRIHRTTEKPRSSPDKRGSRSDTYHRHILAIADGRSRRSLVAAPLISSA